MFFWEVTATVMIFAMPLLGIPLAIVLSFVYPKSKIGPILCYLTEFFVCLLGFFAAGFAPDNEKKYIILLSLSTILIYLPGVKKFFVEKLKWKISGIIYLLRVGLIVLLCMAFLMFFIQEISMS